MLCTRQLLGVGLKAILAPSRPIPVLAAQTDLENATLTFWEVSILAGKVAWALSGYLPTKKLTTVDREIFAVKIISRSRPTAKI